MTFKPTSGLSSGLARDLTAKSQSPIGPVAKGGFHRWLGKKPDEPITDADIQKGLASNDPHVRQMANFARNSKGWGK